MGSYGLCKICGEKICYAPDDVANLGLHLVDKHPDADLAQFTLIYESPNINKACTCEKCQCGEKAKVTVLPNQGGKNRAYKTTIESWKKAQNPLLCFKCGKCSVPLIRRQRHKLAKSPFGAFVLLGCWPICFLPFILGGSDLMYMYCKECGNYLGMYDRRIEELDVMEISDDESQIGSISGDSLRGSDQSELSLKAKPERHNLFVKDESPLLEGDDGDDAGVSNGVTPKLIVICTNSNFLDDSLESLELEGDESKSAVILQNIIAIQDEQAASNIESSEVQNNAEVFTASGGVSEPQDLKTVLPPYSTHTESQFGFQITPPAGRPVVLYSAPPLQGAPPTYSATMRIGFADVPDRTHRLFGRRAVPRLEPSPPFIAPIPPPSYAESQGLCQNQQRPTIPSPILEIEDVVWGPEPTSTVCPNCHNFVITNIHTRRSNLTHFTAMTLCLCGCWPCCLLPYCIRSCKTIYHECPVCVTVIGMYNPW